MPTVGWIQETNIERFWENPYPPERNEPPKFPCDYCARVFPSLEDLDRHLGIGHPLSIPLLHVRAQPAVSDFSIRTTFQPNDVVILNCTACWISKDGGAMKSMTQKGVASFLAAERSSRCVVTLINERSLIGPRLHRGS